MIERFARVFSIERIVGGIVIGVVVLILGVLIVFSVAAMRDDGGSGQWQACLDRGGVVILDRYGKFNGCEIGRHG